MTHISPEDIAELRKQGDLSSYIRSLTGRPPKATPADAPPADVSESRLPRARTGAWPTGTSSPGPIAPIPAAFSLLALDDYRQWLTAGRPACDMSCECGGCNPAPTACPTHPQVITTAPGRP